MNGLEISYIFFLILVFGCSGREARFPTTKNISPTILEEEFLNYNLVFNDEFSGNSLDFLSWSIYSGRVYNEELQTYGSEGVSVHDGLLDLKAQKKSDILGAYTSGKVITQNHFSFKYGIVEARLKIPSGQGFWPAFWIMPEDGTWPPEIDIMEILGRLPDVNNMSIHWGTSSEVYSDSKVQKGQDFSEDFHTFTLKWEPDKLDWYIDGIKARETFRNKEVIPQKEMYIILNLAVGGRWPQNPDQTTIFPNSLLVDYVRVWKKKESL